MADWRGLGGDREWQLEGRLAERQELSGGTDPYCANERSRREFLTVAVGWNEHVMDSGASTC